jgi:surfeit locus 1 family protein
MDDTANPNKLLWQGDWRTTAFALVFVPIFISLGFWQLQRAEDKVVIADTWEQRQLGPAVPLQALGSAPDDLAYRRVELRGEFLQQRDLLLDNRMLQGRYGFELLTPMRLAASGQLVLVNRGWVEGDRARRSLPQLQPVTGSQVLTGTVYVPPGEPYTLGAEAFTENGPQVLLALDMAAIEGYLGEPLFPYTVRLEADSSAAMTIDWPLLNTSPQKHRAYAVQWFCMAAALLLLFLVRSSNIWELWRGAGSHHSE